MNKYLNLPYKQFFKYTLIISLFFHILAIIFSDGFHRPDEHLGIMRWMSFKLGLMDDKILSWNTLRELDHGFSLIYIQYY